MAHVLGLVIKETIAKAKENEGLDRAKGRKG
jgi:hypothetical protein